MTDLVEHHQITCPHCWQAVEITVDLSAGNQRYVEDCSRCCHPIGLELLVNDGQLAEVVVTREQ